MNLDPPFSPNLGPEEWVAQRPEFLLRSESERPDDGGAPPNNAVQPTTASELAVPSSLRSSAAADGEGSSLPIRTP
jgi:hypothetical protein